MEHTKEPWSTDGWNIYDNEQILIADCGNSDYSCRIVACVNFCEDLEQEGIELALQLGRTAKMMIEHECELRLHVTTQRDRMLAEIMAARAELSVCNVNSACERLIHVIKQAEQEGWNGH